MLLQSKSKTFHLSSCVEFKHIFLRSHVKAHLGRTFTESKTNHRKMLTQTQKERANRCCQNLPNDTKILIRCYNSLELLWIIYSGSATLTPHCSPTNSLNFKENQRELKLLRPALHSPLHFAEYFVERLKRTNHSSSWKTAVVWNSCNYEIFSI